MTSEYGPCVLCVLSDEQRDAYQAELDALNRAGVNLLFQPSPDDGLQQIGRIKPRVVVVGMTVDMMEGLEFVALLMRRYPDFDREIIVLPDKGDPFPPVLQRRDPTTGRSSTEQLDFDAATGRILAAVQESDPYAAAVDEFSGPSLTASGRKLAEDLDREADADTPPPQPAPAVHSAAVQPRLGATPLSPRTIWALVIAAAVLIGAAVAAIVFGDDAPSTAPTGPDSAPAAADPEPAPDIAPPQPTPAPDEPAPDEPPPSVDLSDLVTLPLGYEPGESAPGPVSDARALDAILGAVRAALQADPDVRVEVGGHTSREGSAATNRELGRRRARVAADWLVERGIPEDRIAIENYESAEPIAPNDTAEGRSKNRRVTVRVVK